MSPISKAKIPEGPPIGPDAPDRLFVGTSGWAYPTWKPEFYPAGVPAKKFLRSYASRLTSVEVNYTFRALPTVRTLENWLAETPPDFRFSFKAPQRITHFSRLRDADAAVSQFVRVLEPVRQAGKLGLLLFQLPPNFKADAGLLGSFLSASVLNGSAAPQMAFEFRHESWFTDEIGKVLRDHNAAMCVAESDDLVTPETHTATTHASLRLRRSGGYTPEELDLLAERLLPLAADRDTYIYFKHEDEPSGPLNAVAFLTRAMPAAKIS